MQPFYISDISINYIFQKENKKHIPFSKTNIIKFKSYIF